ncbi:MAG: hypothetical protein ACNS60_17425 [Candidatus Cyclobacteriaceae bacterium M2_1C_046]
MKTPIQSLLLVALLLVVLYTSFYKPGNDTHQLTYQLNEQLDSLHNTLHRYNQILVHYDSAYQQLAHTRQRLVRIEDYYNQQLTVQQAELDNILNQLHHLSQHRQDTHPEIVQPIDSLIFAP